MQELFSPLPQHIRKSLQDLPKVLNAALPMQNKHRIQLPFAIEELSNRLTSERGLLSQPYWTHPRFLSAYIWYFLPWNIIRLTRLLCNLKLNEPTPMAIKKNEKEYPRIFADIGSGPLSLPIALWLAKPEWREIPLTIICTDISAHPLQIGQKIFEGLSGKDSPWKIITKRCSLENTATEIYKTEGIPWLITAANVCNELKDKQGQGASERIDELIGRFSNILNDDGQLLFVEPGTRLGGKTILSIREAAQNHDLFAISPCPHTNSCPVENSRTWCHFTFDTQGTPAWLAELSQSAHLRKNALSLSFMLLQRQEYITEKQDIIDARIISAPFSVPEVYGMARYACCEQGLALLGRAESLPSGALVRIESPNHESRLDKKSGAFMVKHHEFVEPLKESFNKPIRFQKKNEYDKKEQVLDKKKKEQNKKASKKNTKKFWEK